MQFAIPHAPRRVRFSQVPGAVGRLVRTLALGLLIMAFVGAVAGVVGRFLVKERVFLIRAQEVEGVVAEVQLVSLNTPRLSARVVPNRKASLGSRV